MTKKRAFIEHVSAADYEALLPERLPNDALSEGQPLSLLIRENSRSPDAYRIVATTTQMNRQFGFVAFKMTLLDPDFQPASRLIDSAVGQDNMWSGKLNITARDRTFTAPTGFFVPYESPSDDTLLDAFESLDISRLTPAGR